MWSSDTPPKPVGRTGALQRQVCPAPAAHGQDCISPFLIQPLFSYRIACCFLLWAREGFYQLVKLVFLHLISPSITCAINSFCRTLFDQPVESGKLNMQIDSS